MGKESCKFFKSYQLYYQVFQYVVSFLICVYKAQREPPNNIWVFELCIEKQNKAPQKNYWSYSL